MQCRKDLLQQALKYNGIAINISFLNYISAFYARKTGMYRDTNVCDQRLPYRDLTLAPA